MVNIASRNHVFQQDGVPAIWSKTGSDNVDMVWSKKFWPPNSPDFNPIWSVVEKISKPRAPNVTSLRTATEAVFAGMDWTFL